MLLTIYIKKISFTRDYIKYTKYLFQYIFIVISQNEATAIFVYHYMHIFNML